MTNGSNRLHRRCPPFLPSCWYHHCKPKQQTRLKARVAHTRPRTCTAPQAVALLQAHLLLLDEVEHIRIMVGQGHVPGESRGYFRRRHLVRLLSLRRRAERAETPESRARESEELLLAQKPAQDQRSPPLIKGHLRSHQNEIAIRLPWNTLGMRGCAGVSVSANRN